MAGAGADADAGVAVTVVVVVAVVVSVAICFLREVQEQRWSLNKSVSGVCSRTNHMAAEFNVLCAELFSADRGPNQVQQPGD